MYDNLSAMTAFAGGIGLSAHNIANISTDNYSSLQYHYGAGAAGNVALQIHPPQLSFSTGNDDPGPPLAIQSSVHNIPAGHINNDVGLAYEMTNYISTQHAFEANALAISARDEMQKSLYEQVNGYSLVSHRI